MPHWLIKSATHRVMSWLPNPQAWNYLLQTHVTRSLLISHADLEYRARRAARMLEQYFAYSRAPRQAFTVLELGTGWNPIASVAYYLSGAERVWTIDIDPLLRPAHVARVLELFAHCADCGALATLLPQLQASRLDELRAVLDAGSLSARDMLARLNIDARVSDARRTELPGASIDVIVSEHVISQIAPDVLAGIFREYRRLASAGAVMVHALDLLDYYARFDRRISEFNNLRYSGRAWRWLNSPIEFQNRLRIADYRRLHQEAGFTIVEEDTRSGAREDLERITVHSELSAYSIDDLLVTSAWLASVPAAATPP